MKQKLIRPTPQQRIEIADVMLEMRQRGHTLQAAAKALPQWSYGTCVLWLRRIHGDNAGRRTPPGNVCTRCGGPPTERDAEDGLTRIRDPKTKKFVWLCSNCLVPNEDDDLAELRQRWLSQNPYGTRHVKFQAESAMPHSAVIPARRSPR